MAPSMQQSLSPHALSPSETHAQFGPFLALTARLLGAAPSFLSLAHLSPLTYTFYLAALRPCFRLPLVDVGLSPLSARQRRLALLESSLAHGCGYCASHIACMGDVVSGPLQRQCARGGGLPHLQRSSSVETESDAAVVALVRAACAFPPAVTPRETQSVVAALGEDGLAHLTSMLAFVGWLNFTMDAAGMRLEPRIAPFARLALADRAPPMHVDDAPAEREQGAGEREARDARRGSGATMWARLVAHVRNAGAFVSLLPSVAASVSFERRQFAGIPSTVRELDGWMGRLLGFVPDIFRSVQDPVLKRSVGLGLKLVFGDSERTQWKFSEKCALMYVFGRRLQDDRLAQDAGGLDSVRDVQGETGEAKDRAADKSDSLARRESHLDEIFRNAASMDSPADAFAAAARYIYACAGPAGGVSEAAKDDLLVHASDPGSVVDLAGMAGMFGFLHRVSVLVPSSAS